MGRPVGSRTILARASAAALAAAASGSLVRAASNALAIPAPASNAPTALDEIRGIKDPVPLPGSYTWLWWLLGIAILAALAWWAWRRWSRRQPPAPEAILIPPHRRAKDRLRSAGELLSDPYRFCSLVSDVVRVYLEERFNLHAPDRTTEEFLDEMRVSTLLLPAHKTMLEQFLTRCDMVKFARAEPAEPELKALLDAALRLIDETAPAETEPVAQPLEGRS